MRGFTRVYKPTNDEINNISEYCKLVFFGKPEKSYPRHIKFLHTITTEWEMEAIVKVCHSVLLWSLENCSVPSNTDYHIHYHTPKYNNYWRGKFLNCGEKILGIKAPFGTEWEAETSILKGDSGVYETFYPNKLIKEFNGSDFWIDAIMDFAIKVFLTNDWQGHELIFKRIFFNLGLQSPLPIIQLTNQTPC